MRSLKIPFHLAVFSIFPIVSLYLQNWTEVRVPAIVVPLIFALLVASGIWLVLCRLLGDRDKAGVLATTFVFLFFSYGHFTNMLLDFDVMGFSLIRNRYRATLYLCLGFLLVYFLWRGVKNHRKAGGYLNVMASALLCLILVRGVWAAEGVVARGTGAPPSEFHPEIAAVTNCPDIYHILLDGYAGPISLKATYGFDDPFFARLREKGFYIADESFSNYAMTFLCLASLHGMNYFLNRKEYESLEESRGKARNVLRLLGYKIINVADRGCGLCRFYDTGDFAWMLMRTSMLDMIANRFNFYAGFVRAETRSRLESVAAAVKIEGPKYVFAHIVSPHPPYVFRRDGSPARLFDLTSQFDIRETSWDDKTAYLDQLIYISGQVEKLVDAIRKNSKNDPIIIIHADHGSLFTGTDRYFYLRQMAILNALYFPGNAGKKLYRSISPVNIFRLIFSEYFGLDYDLLPDRHFYSTMKRPFDFTDVSDGIEKQLAEFKNPPPR